MAFPQGVLIDLSGTIHIGKKAIEGCIEALSRLRSAGVKIKFVSNTTKEPAINIVESLNSLGFTLEQHEVMTALTAARQLVESQNLRPHLMLSESAKEEFQDIHCENPNVVIVGLAPTYFCYEELNVAFRLISNGAPLIATHKGRYYNNGEENVLGPGPFVSALEYATGVTAQVIGKPTRPYFEQALNSLGITAEDAVMIGDDIRDDVGGAQACGIRGILVQTGKYTPGDEINQGITPDVVCRDFCHAVEWILDQRTC